MIQKLYYASILTLLAGAQFSCTENISDCPTKMCILASENGWQLAGVYEDGIKLSEDVSQYKIILAMPNSDAAEGTFSRTNTSSTADSGIWKTENNDEILSLIPDNDVNRKEPYIIDTFTPRQLILVINRDSKKIGPTQLKYVFEPI